MTEMNDQLSLENYSPFEVEKKWQEKWESLKAFSPNPEDDGEPFCVVIPPPNVTGSLHMGHAFNTDRCCSTFSKTFREECFVFTRN